MATVDIETIRPSEPVFRLTYDGPALRDHEIDVADLAASLIAVGQMVKAANRAINGDRLDVRVKVRSTGDGSFWVELVVYATSAWGAISDFITGKDVDAVLKLLQVMGLIGTPTAGALAVIRKIKGRRVRRVERKGDSVQIEVEDGTTIETEELTSRVVFDPAYRAALERVAVEPLLVDGIDECVLSGDGVDERITREDAPAFIAPPINEDTILENLTTKVFSIDTLSFKRGKKWRLSDGHGRSMLVNVEDAAFIGHIDQSEIRFAKGDLLYCDVRETARETAKGLKAEYSIVRVREHRPATKDQGNLDL